MGRLITLNLLERSEVEKLHKRIKPVVRFDGDLWTIRENYDVCNTAYLWEAKKAKRLDESNLRVQCETYTLHKCGHPMLFKPSVQEVLSCIEDYTICRVVHYYELFNTPQNADDLNAAKLFTNNFLHLAKARLYYDPSLL